MAAYRAQGAGGDAKDARGEFEIPVSPEWQRHDLHISAQIAAPDSASRPAGKQQGQSLRSVGLVPLTLNREARRLPLTLSAPDKAVPLTRLEVTATSTPNSQGRVVLAAVDRGVLNISYYQPSTRSRSSLAASASPKICSTTTAR